MSNWVMRKHEYEPGLTYEEHILKLEEPLLLRVLQVDDPKRPDHYEASLYAVMPEADWAAEFPEGLHEEAIIRDFTMEGVADAKRRIIELTTLLLSKSLKEM